MAATIETVALVLKEVFVYKIPPRSSSRGYRGADWDLGNPMWTGRLRITSGVRLVVALLDATSGELFAQCPVDAYPGTAVEPVTDSSRYFVLRIDDGSGRHAFIGIGFAERTDAFDFNVALQDHFKKQKQEDIAAKSVNTPYVSKNDLTLKEGQTFKLNIKTKKSDGDDDGEKRPTPTVSLGGGTGGLLPPPGGLYHHTSRHAGPPPTSSNPFGDVTAPPQASSHNPFAPTPSTNSNQTSSTDPFDWASFSSSTPAPSNDSNSTNWVKF